jgi:hypothetical protein
MMETFLPENVKLRRKRALGIHQRECEDNMNIDTKERACQVQG